MVKNLPAVQKTWVQSLGQEDPLEKGMANHSRTLVWRIPWTEEPGGYSPWGGKQLDTTEQLTHTQSDKLGIIMLRERFLGRGKSDARGAQKWSEGSCKAE